MSFLRSKPLSIVWAAFAIGLLSISVKLFQTHAATTTIAVVPAGIILGKVKNDVESFNGIPYAESPTGPLRMKPPVRIAKSLGFLNGTGSAAACYQFVDENNGQALLFDLLGAPASSPFSDGALEQSEDCLSVTVVRPRGTRAGDKLPVLYWIFGGGFDIGWSSMYDASSLVAHSKSIGQPFIFVAVQYRVAGFGFMPGKEIMSEGSGNAGLLDQRMGLEWVADNIAAFGGDSDKVSIWGQSAGAVSVLDQLVLYDGNNTYRGKPLFRGAIMNSGGILPADPLDCPRGQAIFDQVANTASCSQAKDKLSCLRALSATDFRRAVSSVPYHLSYTALAMSYLPRPDGKVMSDSPDALILKGKYAAVPVIIGVQEDEGTIFSLYQSNRTTAGDLAAYLRRYYFARASRANLIELIDTYGSGIDAVTSGSPFRSGVLNEISLGYKRRAAILGDLVFTLARRVFLTNTHLRNPNVSSWSYMASYGQGTPILGTMHGSDILPFFYGNSQEFTTAIIRTYYANFVSNLDPNVGVSGWYPIWPQWSEGNNVMNLYANDVRLLKDDFRLKPFEWIMNNREFLRF